MKIKVISTCLSLILFAATYQSYASGIPTVDVANIAQLVSNAQQQAQQALDQLNETKAAIQQAKSQYDHYKNLVTGNNKLGDFLNDPLLNKVLPLNDWSDIYSDTKNLADLRSRYGLTSSDPKVQQAFDKLLQQAGALEDTYNASSQRVDNAEQLRQRLNTVQTPQEREELALRLQQEQLELQNQQIKLQNIQMLMVQKEKIEDKKRAQAFWNKLEGNP
ncbi:P-type DNA transfer protein VirB5 [Salmonella enterica]|nr:P-type DNA transfer protein VirB5 [Salmonella enterica]